MRRQKNLARTTLRNTKLAYISYIVPIISFGSSLPKPSKSDLDVILRLQRQLPGFLDTVMIENATKAVLRISNFFHSLYTTNYISFFWEGGIRSKE